jgi:hypothetical protein
MVGMEQEKSEEVNVSFLNTHTMLEIVGLLPGERRLVRPLAVTVEYDDGEFVVSEPRFSIHGSGSTLEDAVSAFRRMFSHCFDVLTSESENLDAFMYEQLEYLRSYIEPMGIVKG